MTVSAPQEPSRHPPLRAERVARIVLIVALTIGCAMVLQPFLPALLFSTAIVVSTWPVHIWILRKSGGRAVLASALSCVLVTIVVLTPTVLVMLSFREAAEWLEGLLKQWQADGDHQLPSWLEHLPLLGDAVQRGWQSLGAGSFDRFFAGFSEPAQHLAVASGKALGNGLLQLMIAVVLMYFFYRDGLSLARRMRSIASLLGGRFARRLLERARDTMVAIMYSVVGAALAQATVATVGFLIAGVPNPYLLGALTFALSIIPIGPPIVWGGAALWLLEESRPGWAVFMALYGLFGISLIDNVLKPLVISRSSRLPFAVTLIGVIGGALAFGVAGVFLGPMLLALGMDIVRYRLKQAKANTVAR
jgi:predicted PurR-regulated permease PerM